MQEQAEIFIFFIYFIQRTVRCCLVVILAVGKDVVVPLFFYDLPKAKAWQFCDWGALAVRKFVQQIESMGTN